MATYEYLEEEWSIFFHFGPYTHSKRSLRTNNVTFLLKHEQFPSCLTEAGSVWRACNADCS